MFKSAFLTAIISGVVATIACLVYSNFYAGLLVDFTEATSVVAVLSNCMMVSMVGCFVYFGLSKIIKNKQFAEFSFNLLVTMASLAAVFLFLKSDDPEFKNEDAQMMIDYYKGFVMPMLFFPALAYFLFKPIANSK